MRLASDTRYARYASEATSDEAGASHPDKNKTQTTGRSGDADDATREGRRCPEKTVPQTVQFRRTWVYGDCEGCARLVAGGPPRLHLEACRRRMYEELRRTDKGKKWMGRAEGKIDEYLEGKVKQGEDKDRALVQEGIASNPDPSEEAQMPVAGEDDLTLAEFGKKRNIGDEPKRETENEARKDDGKRFPSKQALVTTAGQNKGDK